MLSHLDRDIEIREAKEGIFEDCMAKNYEATTQAIGYLSTWGGPKYSKVYLFAMKDEITATYFDTNPNRVAYCIGAIWHEDEKRFSFHS